MRLRRSDREYAELATKAIAATIQRWASRSLYRVLDKCPMCDMARVVWCSSTSNRSQCCYCPAFDANDVRRLSKAQRHSTPDDAPVCLERYASLKAFRSSPSEVNRYRVLCDLAELLLRWSARLAMHDNK